MTSTFEREKKEQIALVSLCLRVSSFLVLLGLLARGQWEWKWEWKVERHCMYGPRVDSGVTGCVVSGMKTENWSLVVCLGGRAGILHGPPQLQSWHRLWSLEGRMSIVGGTGLVLGKRFGSNQMVSGKVRRLGLGVVKKGVWLSGGWLEARE